jgi:hypothetical protein
VDLIGQAEGARLLETGAGESLGECTALAVLLGLVHLRFQRIALGNGRIGTPFQDGGQAGKFLQAVKHIPIARHPGPSQRLTGPQAAPAVGNGVLRVQALRGEVQ